MTPEWTKKHVEYSLAQKFPASVQTLWAWLLEKQDSNGEAEFNLTEFNEWVKEKRGFSFDVKTLKYARDKLLSSEVVAYPKQFTWSIWRWILRPINFLLEPIVRPKTNGQKKGGTPNLEDSNPQSAVGEDITTTTLSSEGDKGLDEKLELCQNAGIEYKRSDALFLSYFSMEQIRRAIAYFLFKRENVDYPEGWLRCCLEHDYAQQYLDSMERNHNGDNYLDTT